METLKRFKVLGATTDFNQCECCGKENLAYTISILDLDFDHVLHFGSTCAAKANKYDTLEAAKKAKDEMKVFVNQAKAAKKDSLNTAWRYLRNKVGMEAIPGGGLRVKCSPEIFQDCANKAFQHLMKDWKTRGEFVYEIPESLK